MTCIVGLIEKEKVWIGGDSAGLSGLHVTHRKDAKVFKVDDRFLIGCTSSFRMINLLRFSFSPPKLVEDQDVYEFMCTSFIDEVRRVFKKGGFAKIDSSVESGGAFLVGFKGRLFLVEDDFQVGECLEKFDAVGCGYGYALGSMYSIQDDNATAEEKIIMALKAATHFSAGVRPPYITMSI